MLSDQIEADEFDEPESVIVLFSNWTAIGKSLWCA